MVILIVLLKGKNFSITKLKYREVIMYAHKLSISLPQALYDFVENYRVQHHCKNRSEVINKALQMFRQMQLEACYREANQEVDEAFEITNLDGLDKNETW